jgi:hypothetical protein
MKPMLLDKAFRDRIRKSCEHGRFLYERVTSFTATLDADNNDNVEYSLTMNGNAVYTYVDKSTERFGNLNNVFKGENKDSKYEITLSGDGFKKCFRAVDEDSVIESFEKLKLNFHHKNQSELTDEQKLQNAFTLYNLLEDVFCGLKRQEETTKDQLGFLDDFPYFFVGYSGVLMYIDRTCLLELLEKSTKEVDSLKNYRTSLIILVLVMAALLLGVFGFSERNEDEHKEEEEI